MLKYPLDHFNIVFYPHFYSFEMANYTGVLAELEV